MTEAILQAAGSCINKTTLSRTKSTHPWLNERVIQAVEAKRVASSTADAGVGTQECSRIVLEEYDRWVSLVRQELSEMKRGSKAWRCRERQLQQMKQTQCCIPALKSAASEWIRDATGKANLMAKTFVGKCQLPAE